MAYDRLGLAFALEGTSVAVGGMAGRGHGAVLTHGGQVLVRESDSPRRDVVALVRLLAPPATQRQMPVVRQTDWLRGCCPWHRPAETASKRRRLAVRSPVPRLARRDSRASRHGSLHAQPPVAPGFMHWQCPWHTAGGTGILPVLTCNWSG